MANCLINGIQIGYPRFVGDVTQGPNPQMLLEDISEFKPTFLGSFPLFYNKIYRNVLNRISKESDFTKSIFDKAIKAKIDNMKNGSGNFNHFFYDTFVFSKIK